MRRRLVYSRVSTDARKREGTSLDTQERARAAAVLAASRGAHLLVRGVARCERE